MEEIKTGEFMMKEQEFDNKGNLIAFLMIVLSLLFLFFACRMLEINIHKNNKNMNLI